MKTKQQGISTMRANDWTRQAVALMTCIVVMLVAGGVVQAADYYAISTNGNWETSDDWGAPFVPDTTTPAGGDDNVWIGSAWGPNFNNAVMALDSGNSIGVVNLYVGHTGNAGTLNISNSSTLSASTIIMGESGSGTITANSATITVSSELYIGQNGGADATIHLTDATMTVTGAIRTRSFNGGTIAGTVNFGANSGLTSNSQLDIQGGTTTTLTLSQDSGATTGFTLDGASLIFDANGVLDLQFDATPGATAGIDDWLFRWQGDHESTLEALIGSSIMVSGTSLSGADLVTYDSGSGYTYIGHAIPEPSSLILLSIGVLGMFGILRRRAS